MCALFTLFTIASELRQYGKCRNVCYISQQHIAPLTLCLYTVASVVKYWVYIKCRNKLDVSKLLKADAISWHSHSPLKLPSRAESHIKMSDTYYCMTFKEINWMPFSFYNQQRMSSLTEKRHGNNALKVNKMATTWWQTNKKGDNCPVCENSNLMKCLIYSIQQKWVQACAISIKCQIIQNCITSQLLHYL